MHIVLDAAGISRACGRPHEQAHTRTILAAVVAAHQGTGGRADERADRSPRHDIVRSDLVDIGVGPVGISAAGRVIGLELLETLAWPWHDGDARASGHCGAGGKQEQQQYGKSGFGHGNLLVTVAPAEGRPERPSSQTGRN